MEAPHNATGRPVRSIGVRGELETETIGKSDLAEGSVRSLFVSANCDTATMRRGEAAHPIGWRGKPFEPRQLAIILAATLSP
jgi:hypothetical protein